MKKYNVTELVEKLESLKYAEWYLDSEREVGKYDNTYKLVELKDKYCLLTTRVYDRNVKEFVVKEVVAKSSDVFLMPVDVVNFEYEELMAQVPEELREKLRDAVDEKCHFAAIAGYNGCI